MTGKVLANYEAEVALFRDLVGSDSGPNILLFQGPSGSGKSFLIDYCLSTVNHIPKASLKLQGTSEAIPTLFETMGLRLGWPRLPLFTGTVARMLEQQGSENDPLWHMGMRRHVGEIGKISDPASKRRRFQLLTEAWFADAVQLDTPFLLAVDGYEQASTTFKRWFSEDFLYGVANYGDLRALLGGRKEPVPEGEWGSRACLHELKGIEEVDAWLDWAAESGFQAPTAGVMQGIILALGGSPSEIVKLFEAKMPRSDTPTGQQRSEVARSKRLRELVIKLFNLEELRLICFDAGIDYENIRGHYDQKSTFVRELFAYARRTGLFENLIELFQAQRPPKEQWAI